MLPPPLMPARHPLLRQATPHARGPGAFVVSPQTARPHPRNGGCSPLPLLPLCSLPPAGTSGRFEIKDRFLPMGGRGGRGGGYGGYGGGRGRGGGGGYSLVLGDEAEERPQQVGRAGS